MSENENGELVLEFTEARPTLMLKYVMFEKDTTEQQAYDRFVEKYGEAPEELLAYGWWKFAGPIPAEFDSAQSSSEGG